MNLLSDIVSCLPKNRKKTPNGWYSFSCVACTHMGKTPDNLRRGGILLTSDSVTYNCFRCHAKAHWEAGQSLSKNMQNIMAWSGTDDNVIGRLVVKAFSQQDNSRVKKEEKLLITNFKEINLPGKPILDWFSSTVDKNLDNCLEYIHSRNLLHQIDRFWWSDDPDFNRRILIPFTWKNIPVGFSARAIDDVKYGKYISSSQPGYVFGIDYQEHDSKFVIISEGLLDAISIEGISSLNNSCSSEQVDIIKNLNKEIILVPDRDKAGWDLIKVALQNNWSVAFPEWENNVKDINDAVKNYGTLFTMRSILESKVTSSIKIELYAREWCKVKTV